MLRPLLLSDMEKDCHKAVLWIFGLAFTEERPGDSVIS